MSGVFVYWDNSNVHHEAQRIAEERDGTPGARYLVRIHFDHLLRLAHADRPLTKADAAGSASPLRRRRWRTFGRTAGRNAVDMGHRVSDSSPHSCRIILRTPDGRSF